MGWGSEKKFRKTKKSTVKLYSWLASRNARGDKGAVSQKGGFGERTLVPVFCSGGTCEHTLVAVFSLVDVSDIFYFFSARGGGEGRVRGAGRAGVDFLLKIPEGGGGGFPGGRGGRGAGRVSAANWGMGGGAKFFFFGAEMSTKFRSGGASECTLVPAFVLGDWEEPSMDQYQRRGKL